MMGTFSAADKGNAPASTMAVTPAILRIITVPGESPVCACLAATIEDDLVVGDFKSRRRKVLEPPGHAFLKVENLPAVTAMKMMMMPLVGSFVAGRLSGNLDTADKTLLLEVFQ
jgi:hypothetical protein